MKNKMLRNGVEMPEVGFGTWKAGETDGFAVLSEAIRAGYRHIDTASAYHTEEAVGRAVAASGVDRSEFFITTKAWKDQLGYDRTLAAFDASVVMKNSDRSTPEAATALPTASSVW